MKKILAVILCAALALSMLACAAPGTAPADTGKQEEAAKPEDAGAEEAEAEPAGESDNPWADIMDYSDEATIVYTVFGNKPNAMDETDQHEAGNELHLSG